MTKATAAERGQLETAGYTEGTAGDIFWYRNGLKVISKFAEKWYLNERGIPLVTNATLQEVLK